MGATGLLEQFMGMPDTPENRARFISTIPMGRLSEARDIANAALYLASDEADFITGVVLEVDGGRTI
jgi:3-oxoacyl-[acyl-carrier protein] reductase